MRKHHRKYGRKERLIRYAIEIFDLVEMDPAATTEQPGIEFKSRSVKNIKTPVLKAG